MQPINQQVYYVPVVKFKEDKNIYPINQDNFFSDLTVDKEGNKITSKTHVFIQVHNDLGCNITAVKFDKSHMKLTVNTIIPKFQLGQVVCRRDGKQPFRIYQHCLVQGKVWYRDGWGVAQGLESGRHEEDLILYTGDSDSWEIKHHDDIMEKLQPSMYNAICK